MGAQPPLYSLAGLSALSFDHDRVAVEVVQNSPVFELEL
jgi:hypothetical protein